MEMLTVQLTNNKHRQAAAPLTATANGGVDKVLCDWWNIGEFR